MSAELDLTIDRQDDETFRFQVKDSAGAAIDLTGQTLQFQIFPDKNCVDADILVEVETDPLVGADAVAGIGDVTIPSADTDQSADKKLYYKARLLGAGGTPITTLTRGKLTVQG